MLCSGRPGCARTWRASQGPGIFCRSVFSGGAWAHGGWGGGCQFDSTNRARDKPDYHALIWGPEHGHQRQNGHAELGDAFFRRMVRVRGCSDGISASRDALAFSAVPEGAAPMNDTIYRIFLEGKLTKSGSRALANYPKKQTASRPTLTRRRGLRRLSVLGRSEPSSRSRYLRHTCGWSDLAAAKAARARRFRGNPQGTR